MTNENAIERDAHPETIGDVLTDNQVQKDEMPSKKDKKASQKIDFKQGGGVPKGTGKRTTALKDNKSTLSR